MKKSELKQIIREELQKINEVDYAAEALIDLGDRFQKVISKYDKKLVYDKKKPIQFYRSQNVAHFRYENPEYRTGISVLISSGEKKGYITITSYYSHGMNNSNDTYLKHERMNDDALTELNHPKYEKYVAEATKAATNYIQKYSKGLGDYLKAGGRDWD